MAQLTTAEKEEILAALGRAQSVINRPTSLTKPNGRILITSLDTFQDDNAASINQAIPQPERSLADAAEKAIVFTAVAARRYMRDEADILFLKAVVDELAAIYAAGG